MSEHLFDVPAIVLSPVFDLLAEVEYVSLIAEGKTIRSAIPNVPYFSSLYEGLVALQRSRLLFRMTEKYW